MDAQEAWKIETEFRIENCIGLGIVIGNQQPKKEYKTALWEFTLLFLCFVFTATLSYPYNAEPPQVKQ